MLRCRFRGTRRPLTALAFSPFVLVVLAFVCGCEAPPEGAADFVSLDPTFKDVWRPQPTDATVATGGGGDTTGVGGANGAPPSGAASAVDADVVEVVGDRIYALSSYTGLTVIDASNPDDLVVLGRANMAGVADAMHVAGDTAYVVFHDSSWNYRGPPDSQPGQLLHVEAFDVSDAAAIHSLTEQAIPGGLLDMLWTDDVLYVVATEDSGGVDATTVTSLDISSPGTLTPVDQVDLGANGFYPSTTSVLATPERLYVGGISDVNAGTSTLRVVDISDPAGDLHVGASLDIPGRLSSHWQWDELDGVLRVISQRAAVGSNPLVQTFTVVSSDQLLPLGLAAIILPAAEEELSTVRFDGLRAFATTVEWSDSLYAIDLSDPATPRVRGNVAVPGFIEYIEPHGDQLVALGADSADPVAAGLQVSLFDVSDLDAPDLLAQASLGAGTAVAVADGSPAHDNLALVADLGLIAVPFQTEYVEAGLCPASSSGVRIIDWNSGALVPRGFAALDGIPRRTWTQGGRLFAISDDGLRAFDLSDRDSPLATGDVRLATFVGAARVASTTAVRLASTWVPSRRRIETVPVDALDNDSAMASLDLEPWFAPSDQDFRCFPDYGLARLFARDAFAFVAAPSDDGTAERLLTIDVADPSHPVVRGQIDVRMTEAEYGTLLASSGDPVVQVGSRLVFEYIDGAPDFSYYRQVGMPVHGGTLTVVDLSDPASPRVEATLPLPEGLGHTGLVVVGDDVLFSHWVPNGTPSEVRFYLDRLALGGAAPTLGPPVSVPGSFLAYDAESDHVLTADYASVTEHVGDYAACVEALGDHAEFSLDGTCKTIDRELKVSSIPFGSTRATVLDASPLTIDQQLTSFRAGEDRLAYAVTTVDSYRIDVVGGIRAGALAVARVDDPAASVAAPLAFDGRRIVATSPNALLSIDTANMADVQLTKVADLPWWTQDLTLNDGRAIVSLGPYGVASIELP